MDRLFFLMTILALVLGTTIAVVGCGDDDDDDDDDDDVTDDTDDDTGDTCTDGLTALYDCGYALYDADSNELALADAIASCDGGDAFATCAAACGASVDCDGLEACVGSC